LVGACGAHKGGGEKFVHNFNPNTLSEGKLHLGVDRRIILTWILKHRMCARFI